MPESGDCDLLEDGLDVWLSSSSEADVELRITGVVQLPFTQFDGGVGVLVRGGVGNDGVGGLTGLAGTNANDGTW